MARAYDSVCEFLAFGMKKRTIRMIALLTICSVLILSSLCIPVSTNSSVILVRNWSIGQWMAILHDYTSIPHIPAMILRCLPKQQGVYDIRDCRTVGGIIWAIVKRRHFMFSVKVVPGTTLEQLQRLLNIGLIHDIQQQELNMLANTYSYTYYTKCSRLLQMMRSKHLKSTLILASIVEKEADVDEYHKVAQVFLNRLKIGMRLDANATIVFVTKRLRVLYKDLTIDSPYNTYRYAGLPPEPICVPSAKAVQAVMEGQVNFPHIYFVKVGGKHVFSKNLAEHAKHVHRRHMEQRARDQAIRDTIR